MEVSPADPESICRLISSHRYHFTKESILQDGIAAVLGAAGIPYQREYILTPKRRIDFLLDRGIGIEIKVKGSPSAVIEQLIAYAELPAILTLILVTARLRLGDLPATLSGKPVYSVPLWHNGI